MTSTRAVITASALVALAIAKPKILGQAAMVFLAIFGASAAFGILCAVVSLNSH